MAYFPTYVTPPRLFCTVTTKVVFTGGFLAVWVVAMHSNVLPRSAGTVGGQTTVDARWRWARMLCSIERATLAVSTLTFAGVELFEDFEPHALNTAAKATVASTATTRPQARAALGLGDLGRVCIAAA
jgi:hypothetical protein